MVSVAGTVGHRQLTGGATIVEAMTSAESAGAGLKLEAAPADTAVITRESANTLRMPMICAVCMAGENNASVTGHH